MKRPLKNTIPPDLRESRGSRPLECRSNRTSSSRLNGELHSAPELINLKLTWPRSVGRSHLGVHYRQAVPQLQTWRSFLVRERWMAFLIHSWAGQKSQLLWILASGHFFDNLFCTFIALTIDFLNSWKKSGGSNFHVWFATTLTRSKISRCTQGHESLDLNTLTRCTRWCSLTTRSTRGCRAPPTCCPGSTWPGYPR